MPQMDDATLRNLQRTIEKVARRSYRIREWWDLEFHLRDVERSFKPFNSTLQQIKDPEHDWPAKLPTLKEFWSSCLFLDIPELNGFAQRLEHIHEPFEPDSAANYPDPREGIAALGEISKMIYEALVNAAFKDVQDQSHKFQIALAGQLATRRAMMDHEVEQLCHLAHDLQEKLMT